MQCGTMLASETKCEPMSMLNRIRPPPSPLQIQANFCPRVLWPGTTSAAMFSNPSRAFSPELFGTCEHWPNGESGLGRARASESTHARMSDRPF